jgi:hypothetical protein
MKKIAIYHHLGMGDSIECNGMVRHYTEKHDVVDIFSKDNYYESCKFMYRDSDKIRINKVDGKNEYVEVQKFLKSYDGDVLIPGHQNYFKNLAFFSSLNYGPGRSFYDIAGIPWKYRNEKFYFERDLEQEKRVLGKLNPNGEKFVFVHDDMRRGFVIDLKSEYKIIKNDPTESFFNMLGVLEAAEEVHCMSSSFFCLIDCLDRKIKIKNKFLHKSIRNVNLGDQGIVSNWNII